MNKVVRFEPEKGERKVSIEELRAIWNSNEVTYTDEELYRIRDWFYMVAEITVSSFNRMKAAEQSNAPSNIISLTASNNHAYNEGSQESHSLHPGIYRRAS